MTARFAGTKECARSLTHVYVDSIAGGNKFLGQIVLNPDKLPFIKLGEPSPEALDPDYPLDALHRFPSTATESERCILDEPLPPFQEALPVDNSIHISGDFYVDHSWGSHIGEARNPSQVAIKSNKFSIAAGRMLYQSSKRQSIAHKPHREKVLEVCAVIKGRVNFAMASACQEYYDLLSLKQGQIAVLFPGIFHTTSADAKEDGETMCLKILPTQWSNGMEMDIASAVAASQIASKSMDLEMDSYFKLEKDLMIFNGGEHLPPGYGKLGIKVHHYGKDEGSENHVEDHDLIVAAISGSIVIIGSGNSRMVVPEHQYAFIPAGVEHEFVAFDGAARVLCIEMRSIESNENEALKLGKLEKPQPLPQTLPQSQLQSSKEEQGIGMLSQPNKGDQKALKSDGSKSDKSLLLLMSVKIQDEATISKELSWIQDDFSAVCEFYATCHWMVNVVATSKDLLASFQQASSSFMLNVKWSGSISTKPFNKFIFVQKHVDEMLNYDLVLLKDNDQRISSFSWPTFIEKSSDSVMSGPLRRKICANIEGCRNEFTWAVYEADHYERPSSPKWSLDMHSNVTPVEVPFLEMYFVLMDAKFANFYFNLALRDAVINDVSDYGPDSAWCAAAKVWDGSRPGCSLVPVVSDHENTRQIEKSEEFHSRGMESYGNFQRDPILGGWMKVSSEWKALIEGARDLNEMELGCRRLLDIGATVGFDLQACATKSVDTHRETLKDQQDTLNAIENEMNQFKPGSSGGALSSDLVGNGKRLNEARNRLTEQLRVLEARGRKSETMSISDDKKAEPLALKSEYS